MINWKKVQRYYFDHNATTPLAPEVLQALTASLAEVYGNASSIHHFGQRAKQSLETARRQIAARIRCTQREIVFTSGGTESDNLAIFGIHRARGAAHAITSTIEHPAVLNCFAELEHQGVEVTYLPVGSSGVVDPDDVRRAIRPGTKLVSVMHANNEVGTLQPIQKIAAITRPAGIALHSDGVQVPGRMPLDVHALGVDLYSLSGHKMYAPKGIGALYVREGLARPAIAFGGHHERERRPGTENVPGAVALGVAASQRASSFAVSTLRVRLDTVILIEVSGTSINCGSSPRLPNTTNIRFEGIEGEPMVIALDLRGFAVSSGAACSSGAVEPSHVLTAIGLSRRDARSSLRISLGPSTTVEAVDALIAAIAESAAHLRRIAPAERSLAHA
ncbi:MAG: cysteine desulfurase family protein [Steroidobacteraceae bacterium]